MPALRTAYTSVGEPRARRRKAKLEDFLRLSESYEKRRRPARGLGPARPLTSKRKPSNRRYF